MAKRKQTAGAKPKVLDIQVKDFDPDMAVVRYTDHGGAKIQANMRKSEAEQEIRTMKDLSYQGDDDVEVANLRIKRHVQVLETIVEAWPEVVEEEEDLTVEPPASEAAKEDTDSS